MATDDPRFRKEWIEQARQIKRRLTRGPLDVSIEADRNLYYELHDRDSDPTLHLRQTVLCADAQSAQLVAGFRGVGKTTEFLRLAVMLRGDGFHVLRVDLAEQLDLTSPVDITEFLLVLAGAIGQHLQQSANAPDEETLKLDFWHYIRGFRDPELVDRLKVHDVSGRMIAEVNWQRALRENDSYRERIRKNFGNDLMLLRRVVGEYIQEVVRALNARAGEPRPFVLIVDSLEHIRGRHDNALSVQQSVRKLLLDHGPLLQFEGVHVIYSVPAFLLLDADTLHDVFDGGNVRPWTALHVRRRTPSGELQDDTETIDRLARMVEQRVDWRIFLSDRAALDRLILASGGQLRDLFDLLWAAFANASPDVPADPARALQQLRLGYPNLFSDDVELLKIIARHHELRAVPSQWRDRVARFLDGHLVLPYLNGEFWYDVHPIVKADVERD